MTTELSMLLYASALALFLSSVPLFRAMRLQWGIRDMLGNREDTPPLSGWGGRTVRAYDNLIDNLVLFGIAVAAVQLTATNNETSALAAQIFFTCRLIHAFCYITGIPVIRTLAYMAGAAATVVVALQAFGG